MNKMRFWLLAFVGLIYMCFGQAQRPNKPQELENADSVASVDLVVSTTFGKPVGKALAIMRAVGPPNEYRKSGQSIRFETVPFGL